MSYSEHSSSSPKSEGEGSPFSGEFKKSIDQEYTRLNTTFTSLNQLIPLTGLEVYAPTLSDKSREFFHKGSSKWQTLSSFILRPLGRQTHPDQAVRVRDTLSVAFTESEQIGIVAAANDLLTVVSSNMDWKKRDGIPYGQVDSFLVGFPENIIEKLGEHVTAENITKVLQIGLNAANVCVQDADDESLFLTESLASIVEYVGKEIPMTVARAEEGDDFTIEDIKNFTKKKKILSPDDLNRIERLEQAFRRVDSGIDRAESPFNQKHAELNTYGSLLGKEERSAKYGDLGAMVRKTERNDREYGLVISNLAGGVSRLQFLEGSEGSIGNKAESNGDAATVFFHSHPSYSEATAPLVSRGDLVATKLMDYGGGYLNVVCANGITFHVGSVENGNNPVKRSSVYTVESGEMMGRRISPTRRGEKTDVEVMADLNAPQEPYVYSITDDAKKLFFVHVPWTRLSPGVNLDDVCFGDGLPRVLASFSNLPEDMPRSANLHTALTDTKNPPSKQVK